MSGPIVLAAGGTGGHLFPAQALARELGARGRQLVLVTDRRGKGYEDVFGGIPVLRISTATPTRGGVLARLLSFAVIAVGAVAARRLLRRITPSAVVGFGGYPSLPTMLAAAALRLPTAVHEQNAVLGRANRVLAPRVNAIAAGFDELSGLRANDRPKLTRTGNPVREEVRRLAGQPYSAPLPGGEFRLLVFGGSQGARIISDVVPAGLRKLSPDLQHRLVVSQQCRAEDRDAVERSYREAGIRAEVATFFADLPARLAVAHLVIARSGAGTVSELAVSGRPAILVPYRLATDDHQTANARALAAAGGAWLVPETAFTPEDLAGRIAALAAAPEELAAAARQAHALGVPDAAQRLADLIEALAPANGDGRTGARPARREAA